MTHGSQQLRRFRIARRDGASIEEAAQTAGIDIVEARMHAADDDKNPPPPEAYVLLGHNSGNEEPMAENVAVDLLRQGVEAIERLESEEQGIKDDKKDRYALMKSQGFDVKQVRKLIAMRKAKQDDRTHDEAVLATYAAALGMQLGFDI